MFFTGYQPFVWYLRPENICKLYESNADNNLFTDTIPTN